MIHLRPYQVDAVNQMRALMQLVGLLKSFSRKDQYV